MLKKNKHLFKDIYTNDFILYYSRKVKSQTLSTFKYNFSRHILSYFSNMYIEDIKEKDIIQWQDKVLKNNYCNNHNKNLYGMLKRFFDYCTKHYNFDDSILLEVGGFKNKVEKKRKDFYTLKEFKLFISCMTNEVYKQFFNFMFFTGTRPGEAMALRFSDLVNDTISINKTISEHGKREIGTPKTSSSYREIIIDKKLHNDLLKLKNRYINQYNDTTFDYFIFGGKKPLSPTTINRYKEDACKKANLRPITLHQFRHSHATLLLNKGLSIHVISERLGHSKVSTTYDVYTHADFSQEKRVYDTLNSMRFNFFRPSQVFKKIFSILKH